MSAAVTRAVANELGMKESHRATRPDDSGIKAAPTTAETCIECVTPDGVTALMRAACDGALDTVQDLLTRGVDVNAKRTDDFTALSLAAFFGHLKIVELLLERGADVEATCRFGTSAEMWARSRGLVEITESLKKARLLKNNQESTVVPSLAEEHPSMVQVYEHEDSPEVGDDFAKFDEDALETPRELKRNLIDVTQERAEKESSVGQKDQLVGVHTARQTRSVIDESYRIPDPFLDTLQLTNENPEFRRGLIFLARAGSSGKNLAVLTLVVMLVCGTVTFAILKIHAKVSSDHQERSELKNLPSVTQRPGEPKDAVPSLEQAKSDQPDRSASSAGTDSASSVLRVERNSSAGKREWQSDESTRPKASQAVTDTKSLDIHTDRTARNKISAHSKDPGSPSTRLPITINAQPKQPASEMESKPAPLSVEVSRRHIVSSSASTNTNQGSASQFPGTAITSGKPKSKVIRWP